MIFRILSECRWLYNTLLEERKTAYEQTGKDPSYYEQKRRLPELKIDRPSLELAYSQTLQDVVMRIDLGMKAFFRRVKAGEEPGYPRFRGANRYDSFTYPQSGFSVVEDRLKMSKIGSVRIKLHRPIVCEHRRCEVETLTLRRTSTGKWFACFSCIENPRFFRKEEKALAQSQRRMEKAKKCELRRSEKQRRKRKKVVARVHERIGNKRRNFIHQEARRIVDRFGTIAVEDLRVNQMVHNHCLAKSIHDASWSAFFDTLFFKAECAGRRMIAVNPAYTTQDCNRCRHRQPMPLSERVFDCPCCGYVGGRDHNASLNIMALGLQGIGEKP